MYSLLPQIVWTGISVSYYSGVLALSILLTIDNTDTKVQFQETMIAMVFLGIGSFFGTILSGQLSDSFLSFKPSLLLNVFLLSFTLLVTLAFLDAFVYNWLAFAMAFAWGMQDGAVATHTYWIIGIQQDNSPHAYAIYSLFQSLTVLLM